ncbi:MAG: hypothetical protein ABGX08_17435 [Citromicrobium sp.]
MVRGSRWEALAATPAAGFRPVNNGTEIIRQIFPGARITSGYRGPDHPLSRKNPRSYHAQTRAAVDMAAIPGVTFEQAKRQLEQAGYKLIEAIDEYRNPSANATGGHWHFVIGSR